MEAEAQSPLWEAVRAMASLTSDFTPAQIKAANLSHLTEDQITSLTITATAHDAAVEASKAAIKAAEDVDEARRLAAREKRTADLHQLDYENAINDGKNRRLWLLKKNANLATKKAKAAEDAAYKAMEVATNAVGVALEAIAKANQAELDNAKVVLKADLSAEVARTVRLFGSGLIQERTLQNKIFSSEYRFSCYSILSKFIVTLKDTKSLDLFVSPKREEMVELCTSLKGFGFNGNWVRHVRKALSDDSNLLLYFNEVKKVKESLDEDISKTEVLNDDRTGKLLNYVNGILSALVSRLPTYSKVDLPNPPVYANPPNSQANPPDT